MKASPLQFYRTLIDSGQLYPDAYQARVVDMLHRLYLKLIEKPKKQSGGLLSLIGLGPKPPPPPNGLYIYGGVGRGKSMLMDMFFDCLPPEDIPKRRVHFHQFMIEAHDFIHEKRSEDDKGQGVDSVLPQLVDKIAEETRVLCFDEFHITDIADAMILGRLFTLLFEKGVIIVATSNWKPDNLYEGGLQRELFIPFIELLKDKLDVIQLDGPTDYRAQSLENTPLKDGAYFYPIGRKTLQKMEEVFLYLTDYVGTTARTLSVKGREIPIKAAAGSTARLSFSDLCEQPHGAEDYLLIAKSFKTILIDNVPKMGYDRRNEAKRFMTLIDALYENNVRVIISADAPVEKLYFGKDYEFEFERTASRLMEMQSQEYFNATR